MPFIVNLSSASSTPWSMLVDEAAGLVPECPRPLIERALRRACREFFSDSHCWRASGLTLLTTVASQGAYTFSPPANGELLKVMSAWNGDEELDVETPGESDDAYPGETDSEYRIGVGDGGAEITVSPAPETAGVVIKGSVAYTLASNATGIPTWVYNEYRYGIACGAAAKLVMQPNKPWTDRPAYAAHMAEFRKAITDASNAAGPVRRRPLRTKPA